MSRQIYAAVLLRVKHGAILARAADKALSNI